MFEYFVDEGTQVRGPRWWFLDVVESIDLELLRAVLEETDRRRGEILRRREHPISIPLRCGVVCPQPQQWPFSGAGR
jgi:hypothetical protein